MDAESFTCSSFPAHFQEFASLSDRLLRSNELMRHFARTPRAHDLASFVAISYSETIEKEIPLSKPPLWLEHEGFLSSPSNSSSSRYKTPREIFFYEGKDLDRRRTVAYYAVRTALTDRIKREVEKLYSPDTIGGEKKRIEQKNS